MHDTVVCIKLDFSFLTWCNKGYINFKEASKKGVPFKDFIYSHFQIFAF